MAMREEHLMTRVYALNLLKPTRNHYTMSQMDKNSDEPEDIKNAHQAMQVIEQGNATDATTIILLTA